MGAPTPELLVLWHAEHAKFGRLLGLLEKQIDAFHDGGDPNFTLLTDIVEYLHGYGDAQHHPREDVGFRRLLLKDPTARAIVQRLLQEHRVIADSGRSLLAKLERLAAGEVMPRTDIESAAATYLLYYRHHLMKEESDVLPQIAACFTADDWVAVATELKTAIDPLAATADDARFARLRQQISRGVGEAAIR